MPLNLQLSVNYAFHKLLPKLYSGAARPLRGYQKLVAGGCKLSNVSAKGRWWRQTRKAAKANTVAHHSVLLTKGKGVNLKALTAFTMFRIFRFCHD